MLQPFLGAILVNMKVRVPLWKGVVIWGLVILGWQSITDLMVESDVTEIVQANAQASERGRVALERCGACHALTSRENRIGPHLVDIVDRPAGSIANFKYSNAMKNQKIVWTESRLRAFLLDPQRTVPGTAMAIGGTTPSDVDEILEYLDNK